ncbi:MAG: hypothetical protein JST68_09075 [Bacteroidetes bacterium]|nr:hypothetical protein [Bacteroidota bacterium]
MRKKARFFKILGVGLYVLIAVSTVCAQTFPSGKVIDAVVCKTDPTQSYALYIPAKGGDGIVYFFDPHGAGALPVNKYKDLADKYGFILVGSNNSKNGNDWSTSEKIWQKLYEDTRARLKIDANRVYTCGFSGGAKVASFVAIQYPASIKGVIAGGAALPDGVQADNFPFSYTLLAGEGDMNLTDLIATQSELDKTRTRHRIIFFDGKHEWAPANRMELAFVGLKTDQVSKSDYSAMGRLQVEEEYKNNRLIRAAQECQFWIAVLSESRWFKEKLNNLNGNPKYQQERQLEQQLLNKEQTFKGEYMQHFQNGDNRYWAGVIKDLQAKSQLKTAERGMYQRLLAFLSLAFYSLSNRAIFGNANVEARRLVDLYKMADPTNSEAWYFSALLDARAGQKQAAEDELIKAEACGFNDKARLHQQPEFKALNLSRVEQRHR